MATDIGKLNRSLLELDTGNRALSLALLILSFSRETKKTAADARAFDAREWAELTSVFFPKIPDLAPEWTDYETHDPGVSLLEVFWFVSERLREFEPRRRSKLRQLASRWLRWS